MTAPASRRRWPRWLAHGAAVLVGLVAVAAGAWLVLLPDVEQAAVEAALADPGVSVAVDGDHVVVAPADAVTTTTVVFYPGAGVPPAAYVPTWAAVVAETGVRVVIPAMPLGLAVFDVDAAAEVRDGDDGTWWVGGHSLGGAMAASFLGGTQPGDWDGLVLWAAYPPGDGLADRDDLRVLSVAGSEDGLTTLDEVEASRTDLPDGATIVVLDGVNHAQFGAYGEQRGDGRPTVGDERARTLVADATAAGLGG